MQQNRTSKTLTYELLNENQEQKRDFKASMERKTLL